MKKMLLTAAFAAVASVSAWAQTYNFTTTTGTYADLASPTILSATGWDDDTYPVTIPFPFMLGGATFTAVDVNSNGFLEFANTSGIDHWMDVLYTDLVEMNATSTISYQVTGTTPNRILKIQWKNAGFYDGTATENANFQVWLHEGSSNVAMYYGPSNITSFTDIFGTTGGPEIGIASAVTSTGLTGIYLQGSGNAPTAVVLNNATAYPALSSPASNGRIYNFAAGSASGIRESLNNINVTVFPNPVADQLTINGITAKGEVTVTVYDVLGKTVLSTKSAAAATVPVNVSGLKNGTYMLEVISSEGRFAKQIVKL